MTKIYLTEQSLEHDLKVIFPNCRIEPQYRITPYKYDYAVYTTDGRKLLVEYDGFLHYQMSAQQRRDKTKDYLAKMHEFEIVRIPYFVQLEPRTIKILFGVDCEYEQIYPHGFISKDCKLPADFNEGGIDRFVNIDLEKFSIIKEEIIQSLANRKENSEEVWPCSLFVKYLNSEYGDYNNYNKNK